MDSASGVVGRNMATITSSARSRDFPLNGMDSERSSHTTLGWGNSIWNNTSLGSGFGSGVRESSRPRENGAYMHPSADSIEGKTGSGSLVASSESEWTPNRPSWGENATAAMPHVRSSGVSPARKRSIAQAQPSQQFADSPSSYYPVPRASVVGQAPVAKPSKTLLDPTTMNFTSARQVDSLTNGFASFGFGQTDTSQQRPEASVGSWPDAASVHSPTDDRRSTAASEYFGPSSGTPSRSGSLPPSRHGTDSIQYNHQNMDAYSRYATQAGQRQTASFSHGRPMQERSGSIQSDSLQMLGRLSLEHDQDSTMAPHKPSVSGLAPAFTPTGHDLNLTRENYADAQAHAQAQAQAQAVQTLARTEGSNLANAGTFTPESFANGNVSDPNVQFRSFQFDSRSAPNGTGVRQSPFYSHAHTPPRLFDHLNPHQSEQALSHPNSFALIQSKLQGYQLQQERRNFIQPSQFHQQQFQHVLAASQLRNPLAYQYAVPNGIAMNGLPPNLAMAPIPSMMPMMEPPKAPRDHRTQGEGAMSLKLHEFKQSSKTNRRWDLKDIYGHIVEFSGDQHGSRFIQQKLETANSDEKDHVFRELQENSLQLMQDVFGNYVIQKFFEHGDQTQKKILAGRMKGHVLSLSNQMYGCRVVQKALEHVLTDQQAAIVKELEKDVLRTVKDQNGNHVIQKAIERVPMEHIQFIVQAFRGQVGALSVNSYGCRVVQRLLEKVPEPQRRFILAELHAEGPKLISDQYGNYVTQHVIEHGLPEDRAKIISLVRAQLLVFSRHKFASNVVERCLLHGTDEQRREIMLTVIAKNERGENNLLTLIKDGYGNYVIQKIMDTLCRRDYEEFVAVLKPEMEKAKKLISGKQIISVEKKMHRFERVDSASSLTPQRNSISSTTDVPPTPPLTNEAQSPQSSSLPSANTSTVEEPVHTTATANKELPAQFGAVSITNETVS